MQASVAGQRTGEQVRLAQDLEAVADAEHRQPAPGRVDDRVHHRREATDRAAPQVVAVGESTGQDHGVHGLQVGVRVPERNRLATGDPDRPGGIAIVE